MNITIMAGMRRPSPTITKQFACGLTTPTHTLIGVVPATALVTTRRPSPTSTKQFACVLTMSRPTTIEALFTPTLAGTTRPSPVLTKRSAYSPILPKPISFGALPTPPWPLRDAVADFNEAIRLQPGDVTAYFIRGASHADLGRYEKAIADLETALELAQAAGDDNLAAKIEETLEEVRNP